MTSKSQNVQEIVQALGGKPSGPGLPEKGDVTDWLHSGRTKAKLLDLVEKTPPWEPQEGSEIEKALKAEGIQRTVEHLASLSPFVYDQQRISMADKLGIRVTTLDAEVKKLREINNPDKSKDLIETLEPWPEAISGAEILDTIHKTITDYVVMPDEAAVAASLWTVLTYCYDAFRILPVLEIKSPEKRCGKTRLLEVLSGLAYRALTSSNVRPATVYRVIEKCNPCLLIDEADTFLPQNDELRGVLNSGHTRRTAFVTRCNSETNEPERFSTWCPKAIALIGKLPGTLDDRAIVVSLKRKLTTEQTQRLSLDFDDQWLELRQKCLKWANDSMATLRLADPDLPAINNDRALDNWSPLIAIADLAGGDEWPDRAREAMQTIEATKEDDSARILLLKDIQKVFKKRQCDRLWTKNLIEGLIGIEGHPWGEWRKGKHITPMGIAKLLRPFGVKTIQIRQDDKNKKGYGLKQFQDVFARYISSTDPPNLDATTLQSADHAGYRRNQDATNSENVASKNGLKPAPVAKCSVVAGTKGGLGEEDPNLEDLDYGAGCSDTDEVLS